MTQLFIVRHGETEWNVKEIFRGRSDVPLNETGFRQAKLLGDYFKDAKLEAVYASPLKRAIDTARSIAAGRGLEVIATDGLLDFDFGEWQGLTLDDIRKRSPGLYRQWEEQPHLVRIPGAESLDDVQERAVALLRDVVSKHSGNVALVSHRAVNKVLICYMLGLDNSSFWKVKQDNAGVTVFSHSRGQFVLVRHNDVCHLSPLRRLALGDF